MSFFKTTNYGFHASLTYRRSRDGLLDDVLKVAYGNNSSFAEDQMTSGRGCRPVFVNSLILPHFMVLLSLNYRNGNSSHS